MQRTNFTFRVTCLLIPLQVPGSALELSVHLPRSLVSRREGAHSIRVHIVGKLEVLNTSVTVASPSLNTSENTLKSSGLIIFVRQLVKVFLGGKGTNGTKYTSPGKAKVCLASLGVVVREVSVAFIGEANSSTDLRRSQCRISMAQNCSIEELNSSWLQIDFQKFSSFHGGDRRYPRAPPRSPVDSEH
jgi:hypothetical protein